MFPDVIFVNSSYSSVTAWSSPRASTSVWSITGRWDVWCILSEQQDWDIQLAEDLPRSDWWHRNVQSLQVKSELNLAGSSSPAVLSVTAALLASVSALAVCGCVRGSSFNPRLCVYCLHVDACYECARVKEYCMSEYACVYGLMLFVVCRFLPTTYPDFLKGAGGFKAFFTCILCSQ